MAGQKTTAVGCVYWISALLVILGLGMVATALAVFARAGQHLSPAVILCGLCGLGLSAVGTVMLVRMRGAAAQLAGFDERRALSPDQPWKRRPEWQGQPIKAREGESVVRRWALAVVWNVISLPLVAGFPQQWYQESPELPGVWMFPVVGLGLVVRAVYRTIQWGKFGRTCFVPTSLPGVVGGHLGGAIEVPGSHLPATDIKVALRCVRRFTTEVGSKRGNHEKVVWERQERVPRDRWTTGPTTTLVPVLFHIPSGCMATDDRSPDRGIVWRLSADAAVPGVDFAVSFDVPVIAADEAGTPQESG